jgi:hypothetical protein
MELLSIARDSVGSASVGNLAIFAGGFTSGVASNAVYIYTTSYSRHGSICCNLKV